MDITLIAITQFAVSILLAAIATYLGIWLYERATRDIDEWKEIRQGNAAVGLTLAAVVVGLAIILRPAVAGALPSYGDRLAPDVAARLLPLYVLLMMLVRALLGLVSLPCNSEGANTELVDTNGDGEMISADGVHVLRYFSLNADHVSVSPNCVVITDCPTLCSDQAGEV